MFKGGRNGISPLGSANGGGAGFVVGVAIGVAALAFLLTSGVLPGLFG